MHSQLLIEYMRTGWMSPLKKGDSKEQVEAKLGPPEDWKGRADEYAWAGPLLKDYRDSWAWHYGSLCIAFPEPTGEIVPGISLNWGLGASATQARFPAPFTDLPQFPFTLGEFICLLDEEKVRYQQQRTGFWVSEGAVAFAHELAAKERVMYMFPYSEEEIVLSRRRSRQNAIKLYSELLCRADQHIPEAERIRWSKCLSDLKLEEACDHQGGSLSAQ